MARPPTFVMQKPVLEGIRFVDLGVFLKKSKTLILADPHFGMESALISSGTLLPKSNFAQIFRRVSKMFEIVEKESAIETVIVTGDLKHGFGPANGQEWNEILDFLQYLKKHCSKIVLLKGNHDIALGTVAHWENLELRESFFVEKEKALVLHGDHLPKAKEVVDAKIIVIGHEHPAARLREGNKSEKFKCFLKGTWKGRTLIVLPSLCQLNEGSDISSEKRLSPFLKGDLSEFEAWLVEDQPYYFGKLKDLEKS